MITNDQQPHAASSAGNGANSTGQGAGSGPDQIAQNSLPMDVSSAPPSKNDSNANIKLKDLTDQRAQLDKAAEFYDERDKLYDRLAAQLQSSILSPERMQHVVVDLITSLKSGNKNPDRLVCNTMVKSVLVSEAVCNEVAENTASIENLQEVTIVNCAVQNTLVKKEDSLYERIKDMMGAISVDQARTMTYISIRNYTEQKVFLKGRALIKAEIDSAVEYINGCVMINDKQKITADDINWAGRRNQPSRFKNRNLLVEFKSQRLADEVITTFESLRQRIINTTQPGQARTEQLKRQLPFIIDPKPTKIASDVINKGKLAQNLVNASLPEDHPKLALFNTGRCTIAMFPKKSHQEQSTGPNSQAYKTIQRMIDQNQINQLAAAWRFCLRTGNSTNELTHDVQTKGGEFWTTLGEPIMQRWQVELPPPILNLDGQGKIQSAFRPNGDLDATAMLKARKTKFPELFPSKVAARTACASKNESGQISQDFSDWYKGNDWPFRPQTYDQEEIPTPEQEEHQLLEEEYEEDNGSKRTRESSGTGGISPPKKVNRKDDQEVVIEEASQQHPQPLPRVPPETTVPEIAITKVLDPSAKQDQNLQKADNRRGSVSSSKRSGGSRGSRRSYPRKIMPTRGASTMYRSTSSVSNGTTDVPTDENPSLLNVVNSWLKNGLNADLVKNPASAPPNME